MKIFVTYHKETPLISNEVLTPIHAGKALSSKDLGMIGDDTGDNISQRNPYWCELTVMYWMWKNVDTDYYGLFHYRRLYDFKQTGEAFFNDFSQKTIERFGWDARDIENAGEGYDMIMPPKWNVHPQNDFQNVMTIYDFYACDHIESDMSTTLEVIDEIFPAYSGIAHDVIRNHTKSYYCNMFIMKKELFQQYAQWLFTVLFEVEKRITVHEDDAYQKRVFGFLSERLINVFVEYQLKNKPQLKIKEVSHIPFGVFDGQYPYGQRLENKPLWECAERFLIPPVKKVDDPLISVIVPVYNVKKYLAACLNSIVNQAFKSLEIIVVNDGSTDGSQGIIDKYAVIDQRIVPVQKVNGGLSSARNEGLKHATGKYVTFVDSDDFIETYLLSSLYSKAEKDQLEIVFGTTKVVDSDNEKEVFDPYYNETHLPEDFSKKAFTAKDIEPYLCLMQVSAWNKLYRRDLLTRLDARFPDGLCFEDNPFFFKTMLNAQAIGCMAKPLYVYRTNRSGSILTGRTRKFFDFLPISQLCERIIQESGMWESMKYYYWNYKVDSIFHWYQMIHPAYRAEYFKEMQALFASYDMSGYDMKLLSQKSVDSYARVLSGEAPLKTHFYNRYGRVSSIFLKVPRELWRITRHAGRWVHASIRLGRSYTHLKQARKDIQALTGSHDSVKNEVLYLKEQLKATSDELALVRGHTLDTIKELKQGLHEAHETLDILKQSYIDSVVETQSNTQPFEEIKKQWCFYGSIPQHNVEKDHPYLPMLVSLTDRELEADACYIWGLKPWFCAFTVANAAKKLNKPLYFFEDGFLRSICSYTANTKRQYRDGIAFTIDKKTAYYDATQASDLEDLLNSKEVTPGQVVRSRNVINTIIQNKLSKYNNQTLQAPCYGRPDRKKVLVIDQSYRDAAITKGMADESTFQKMAHDALADNPDCDILIKVHPDTIAKEAQSGYFQGEGHENVTLICDAVNPIALFEQVDKVYVCTSQLGFEALMCGKEVHVYGMPFYAGWGPTHDQQTCTRRQRKRTLEEMFHIVYIDYSYYVHPQKVAPCEIEDAIDYLLKLRVEFFEEQKLLLVN